MKKYFTLIAIILLLNTACKKDFLELSDPTRISTEVLFNDANGLNLAVNASYASLQEMYGKGAAGVGIYLFSEVPSDNSSALVSGAGLGDIELFITAPENPNLQTMWTNLYRSVARCNTIIARAPAITMDAALKNRYIAEAKFIRALTYFNMVRIWGGVPLVTTEISSVNESLGFGRESESNIYKQIEQDLKDAETVLPLTYVNADLGRATQGAAKAILGKVYLTEKKYTECKAKLGELLPRATNPSGYDLLPNYADIFTTTNELNKEIIFAVRYSKSGLGTGSPFFNWFLPDATGTNIAKVGGAQGFNTVRQDLYDAFPVTPVLDPRRDISIGRFGTTTISSYTKKYTDAPLNGFDADNDWIVIRYADVMLMYAEAENELNGPANAQSYVNDVRRRAFGTANNLTPAQTSSSDNMRLAIENERRLELNMEGHRWFDLVRTGRAVTVMNAHFIKYQIRNGAAVVQITNRNTLFPIPLREIQINPKLTQNP
ncbi:RagB/SusD family nutrient uptake outer membrane protein [Mucilaginibacter terrae]|uniref:RagB/SusD family nutrient uptake outer membrane protein n=1 Tax=Mucilaginibacter terrae TaxID=1955052 RepID=UPI00363FC088